MKLLDLTVSKYVYPLIGMFTILVMTGCTPGNSTPDIGLTQTVISIQQTQTAMASGSTPQVAPTAQPEVATPIPATVPPQPATIPPPPVAPTSDKPAFEEWIKVANVLAYEDIFYHQKYERYILTTLQNMNLDYGLNYTYLGSAIGEFKKKLLLEAPPGGWDLIIVANEAKMTPVFKGSMFTYLNDALNEGTPVVLELWYLDQISEGTIEPILENCGIEYQKNWKDVSPQSQIMWPLAPEHPILNVPNSDLSFSKTTGIWAHNYDIGDLVKIGNGGDARLLLGLSSSTDQMYGTLTSCLGEHFTLQTFSSHQLDEDTSKGLWENYIYNALKVRYADIFP